MLRGLIEVSDFGDAGRVRPDGGLRRIERVVDVVELRVDHHSDELLVVELPVILELVSVVLQDFCLPHGGRVLFRLAGIILQLSQGLGQRNLGDEHDAHPVMDQAVGDIDGRALLVSAHAPDIDFALAQMGVGFVAILIGQAVDEQEMPVLQIPGDACFRGASVRIESFHRLRFEFPGPSRNCQQGRKRQRGQKAESASLQSHQREGPRAGHFRAP